MYFNHLKEIPWSDIKALSVEIATRSRSSNTDSPKYVYHNLSSLEINFTAPTNPRKSDDARDFDLWDTRWTNGWMWMLVPISMNENSQFVTWPELVKWQIRRRSQKHREVIYLMSCQFLRARKPESDHQISPEKHSKKHSKTRVKWKVSSNNLVRQNPKLPKTYLGR